MRVLVTGTLGYDYIMDFPGRFADRIMADKVHKISLSFLVDTLNKQLGGTAGNIAYTLRLLGINPIILAPAGRDFGEYKLFLRKHHISTHSIPIHRDTTMGTYFVVTDKEDNQIGSFFSGANKYAKNLSIAKHCDKNALVIIAPTEPKAMVHYVKECRNIHISYIFDPAFQTGTFTAEELQVSIGGAQILIGNDYEIELIEQKLGISHEELILMVPILITTVGRKGSIIETRKDAIAVKPAKPKNETDPTGAGDAYRAGFIAGYLHGLDLQICGQMGSVAAVYTVEKYGTMTHQFTKKEFEKRYEENFGSNVSL